MRLYVVFEYCLTKKSKCLIYLVESIHNKIETEMLNIFNSRFRPTQVKKVKQMIMIH